MGTPFLGSGHANLLAPFVRAVKGLNFIGATNDRFIKSLKENNGSLEVANIVQRFRVITEKTKMRLLVGCEEQPVAGSNLVSMSYLRSPVLYPKSHAELGNRLLLMSLLVQFSKTLQLHFEFIAIIVEWSSSMIPIKQTICCWKI